MFLILYLFQVFQGPGFSGSRFFRVQVFQGRGFSRSASRVRVQSPGPGFRVQGPGPGSRVRVQVLEVAKKNGLIRRLRVISKFMTSQSEQQKIIVHIFSNISRSKDNQKMKFGPLIEYNMTNIFPEESYTKFGGETSSRPVFLKTFAYLWINRLNVIMFVFVVSPSRASPKYIKTKVQTTCIKLF